MIKNGHYRRYQMSRFIALLGCVMVSYFLFVFTGLRSDTSNSVIEERLTKATYYNRYINEHVSHNNSQLSKVLSSLTSIKDEVQNLQQKVSQFSKWDKYDEYRQKIKKSVSGYKNDKNPHIVFDDVAMNCHTHHKLIVLVSSHVPNFERRQLIRTIWGNHSMWTTKENWKVLFVIGGTVDKPTLKKIRAEAEEHKDIVMEDIEESFYRLSFKVMVGLKWVISSFRFDFILKCDDDVFVQIDRLISRLDGPFFNKHYIGNVLRVPVLRKGRYGVSKEEYSKDFYDPYCSGGGFILSYKAIRSIIPLFNWKKPLIIDDAYIGHLVHKAGLKEYNVPKGFYMQNGWCEYNEHLLISHPCKIIKCLHFLQRKSMHDNGLAKIDTLSAQRYGIPEWVEEAKRLKLAKVKQTELTSTIPKLTKNKARPK